MNIYVIDFGWEGALFVVAQDKDDAWNSFKLKCPNLDSKYFRQIEEYQLDEIVEVFGSGI